MRRCFRLSTFHISDWTTFAISKIVFTNLIETNDLYFNACVYYVILKLDLQLVVRLVEDVIYFGVKKPPQRQQNSENYGMISWV